MIRTSIPVRDGTPLSVLRGGTAGSRPVVLLHAAVADARSWSGVIDALAADGFDLVAIDRRGFGESPDAGDAAGSHLDDLVDVLDALALPPALLVGNSMGGALAIDVALTAPDRVAGLLLLGAAVSGMTDEGESIDWTPDAATGALLDALQAAEAAGDVEEQVRLELHLWLDGPAQAEGRVGGAVRELAAAMDRRAVTGGGTGWGASGVDAWYALGDVAAPGIAAWGALDLPPDLPFYALTAERLSRVAPRVLPGLAHLPSLEDPALVADLVREAALLARPR